jgi:hypothetical protein
MANSTTLKSRESNRFRAGSTAVRVVNLSKTALASLELTFGSARNSLSLSVPSGGSITQSNPARSPFQIVNTGTVPILIQALYGVELLADYIPGDRLANLWSALDANGFQVERYRAGGGALPGTPSVIYVPDPAGDQWLVALRLKEIMNSQGVSDVALVDSESIHINLDAGNFILLPSYAVHPPRALSCIQVYYEHERTTMALVNGDGWLEYSPTGARIVVTGACVINPPQPGNAYFIASFDGKDVARFNNMSLQQEGIANTYVFTNLSP